MLISLKIGDRKWLFLVGPVSGVIITPLRIEVMNKGVFRGFKKSLMIQAYKLGVELVQRVCLPVFFISPTPWLNRRRLFSLLIIFSSTCFSLLFFSHLCEKTILFSPPLTSYNIFFSHWHQSHPGVYGPVLIYAVRCGHVTCGAAWPNLITYFACLSHTLSLSHTHANMCGCKHMCKSVCLSFAIWLCTIFQEKLQSLGI